MAAVSKLWPAACFLQALLGHSISHSTHTAKKPNFWGVWDPQPCANFIVLCGFREKHKLNLYWKSHSRILNLLSFSISLAIPRLKTSYPLIKLCPNESLPVGRERWWPRLPGHPVNRRKAQDENDAGVQGALSPMCFFLLSPPNTSLFRCSAVAVQRRVGAIKSFAPHPRSSVQFSSSSRLGCIRRALRLSAHLCSVRRAGRVSRVVVVG